MIINAILLTLAIAIFIIVFPMIKIAHTPSEIKDVPHPDSLSLTHHLYRHVEVLSSEIGSRSLNEVDKIDRARNYIETCLLEGGLPYVRQDYQYYNKKTYSNIIVTRPGRAEPAETIVIGAHYDTISTTPGADDNASAVAVLLEMCLALKDYLPDKTLKLVFFTLEEPPVFDTKKMGSYVFAEDAKKRGENIYAMISLEMLGYYSNRKKGQQFPLPFMNMFYPTTPDFILIVGDSASRHFVELTGDNLRQASDVQVETLTVPRYFPGITLSDNSSFWKMGYNAIMITDTGFYRNPNYHSPKDTIGTLDFHKMTSLCLGLVETIKVLCKSENSSGDAHTHHS